MRALSLCRKHLTRWEVPDRTLTCDVRILRNRVRTMKKIYLLATVFVYSSMIHPAAVFAAESSASLPTVAPASTSQGTSTASVSEIKSDGLPFGSISAPKIGAFTINAGIKDYNNLGRGSELQDPKGRRHYEKYEYYGTLTHQSGWGFSAMGVVTSSTFGDHSRDSTQAGNPSLTLIHPTVYQDSNLKITGQLRRSFAVTEGARRAGLNQWAYYSNANLKLAQGWAVFNQLVPRYFAQDRYKLTDSQYVVEDTTVLSRAVLAWLKLGVGQHSIVEWHSATSAGTLVEVFPSLSMTPSANTLIEARWLLPVQKVNEVADSPAAVALDNNQAQLLLQVSI